MQIIKLLKRKARFVAGSLNQRYCIDYELTYSPTLNIECVKFLLAYMAKLQWNAYQF